MKPLFLLAIAAACSQKDDGSSPEGKDTIVLDGQAYTLRLQPVMPPGQKDLFHTVSVLELKITQADGSTSTHALGEGEEGSTASTLPPLDGAVLRLSGRNKKVILLSGQTPPIDLTEGELTQPISLAQVDTLAELHDLPIGLGFAPVAAGEDGRFYIFGGADEGFIDQEASSAIYSVDVGTPSDDLTPVDVGVSLPDVSDAHAGRVGHSATGLSKNTALRGQILIAGGTPMYVPRVGSTYTWAAEPISSSQAFLFDPATETITEVGGLAYPRYGHVAVENHLGEVVAIGGFNDQASAFSQAFAEVFDPGDQSFHQISGILSTGTAHHAAARLGEQGVMSCGGVNYAMDAASECTIISTARETATLAFPGVPTLGPSMVTMADERILFTGGLDMTEHSFDLFASELTATREAWVFESGAWRSAGEMIHPRAWHTTAALPDGRVLIMGGVTRIEDDGFGPANIYWGTAYDPGEAVACAEIFDPATDSFSEIKPCLVDDLSGSLPQPTLLAGAAVDPIHGALIIGGIDQTGVGVTSVMLYRPTPD
jgi:hypothetical protein